MMAKILWTRCYLQGMLLILHQHIDETCPLKEQTTQLPKELLLSDHMMAKIAWTRC